MACSVVLEMVEDKEDSWFEGLEDDFPQVKRMRRVYPRADYTQAPWTVVLRQPSLSIHTSREAKTFRRRLRIPYVFFVESISLVIQQNISEQKGFTSGDVVSHFL